MAWSELPGFGGRKRSKFKNRKIETEEGTFDSNLEYIRWCELKILEKKNIISDLKRQVKFELIPAQKIDGKVVEKALNYVADFTYFEKNKLIVEDFKGFETDVFKIKRKLMLYLLGIRIKVTKDR